MMKLTLCALIAMTAAHDSGSGAQQDTGYAQQDTGYETGYEAPAFQGYVHKAPAVCLGSCPDGARCQNIVTGACSAGYATPTFAAPYAQQAYGTVQQDGTRRLKASTEDASYEQAEPVAQTYAAPAVAYLKPSVSCGAGFIDLDCARLGSRIVLWIAFALLFLPALWFFKESGRSNFESLTGKTTQFFCYPDNSAKNDKSKTDKELNDCIVQCQIARFVSGMICFIASLAYLTMALGYGYTTRCCDGRQFFYARYVDWTITTPLMLYKIMSYTQMGLHEKQFAYAMDILMVIAGLIGALVCGSDKWIFFGFSMLAFLPVMALLCAYNKKDATCITDIQFADQYSQICTLTVVLWSFYPIVWILAEGTGTICAQAEAICYTVLDILAKSFFGFLCVRPRALVCDSAGLQIGSML